MRGLAIKRLSPEEQIQYLGTDLAKRVPSIRASIFITAMRSTNMSLERIPEAFDTILQSRSPISIYALQHTYFERLAKEGQWEKALSESKRIIGLTPPQGNLPQEVIGYITMVIKGDVYNRTKSTTESIKAMNLFMEDVKNGTQKSSWFSIPYPASPPGIAKYEKSNDQLEKLCALLYAGKYDAARPIADAMFASSSSPSEVQNSLYYIAQCINGKAQKLDAANSLFEASKNKN